MKNLKQIFACAFALTLMAFVSTTTNAQTLANVPVTADVEAALALTPVGVDLGTIQTGAVSVIDANANDGATEANLGDGHSAGSLQITGTSGVDVVVSFGTATLDNGSDPLTFTPSVYLGAASVSSGGTVTLTGGDITLDIGGSLAAPGGTGTYNTSTGSGSPMSFTVSYD